MKKFEYSFINGNYEVARAGHERYNILVSKDYVAGWKGYGAIVETGGNYLFEDDINEDKALLAFIFENLPYFEEVTAEEYAEIMIRVADNTGLSKVDFDWMD